MFRKSKEVRAGSYDPDRARYRVKCEKTRKYVTILHVLVAIAYRLLREEMI